MQAIKQLFVEEALIELKRETPKVSVSQISVLSGLRRQEVNRLLILELDTDVSPKSVLSKVIASWQDDLRFCKRSGEPRELSFSGAVSEFWQLVENVTTAINPSTVLTELRRSGLVEVRGKKLRLLGSMFSFEGDPRGGFELLSQDLNSLIRAVEHNLKNPELVPNLHIRTEFDNISLRHLPEISEWLIEQGKEFHRMAGDYISQFDKDINPEMVHELGRGFVALGTFSLTSEQPSVEGK